MFFCEDDRDHGDIHGRTNSCATGLRSEVEEAGREQMAVLQGKLAALENLPADDVRDGEDEESNVEIARWGTPRNFDFAPQEHADFAPALGLDFETDRKSTRLNSSH